MFANSPVPVTTGPSLADGAAARVSHRQLFDHGCPDTEKLPRYMNVVFQEEGGKLCLLVNGIPIGDRLTDKSRVADGYRFHDAFHLAFAGVLGWSPVLRSRLGRRRRSMPDVDEIEDGGRAQMIEEAICHVIYDHGRDKSLHEPSRIEPVFARYVRRLAHGLEVERCEPVEWAGAISAGYFIFDGLREQKFRRVRVDLCRRVLGWEPI
jgi:MazG C-terminal domain